MATNHTARFTAYAAAHGKTPEAMVEHDKAAFPGGCMAGFICWVGESLRAWRKSTGCSDRVLSSEQNAAFDKWVAIAAATQGGAGASA